VFPGWSGCLGRQTEDLIPEFVFFVQKAFYVIVVSSDRQQNFRVVRPVAPKVQRVETGDRQDVLYLAIVIRGDRTIF
jgi:hypothetical protein